MLTQLLQGSEALEIAGGHVAAVALSGPQRIKAAKMEPVAAQYLDFTTRPLLGHNNKQARSSKGERKTCYFPVGSFCLMLF